MNNLNNQIELLKSQIDLFKNNNFASSLINTLQKQLDTLQAEYNNTYINNQLIELIKTTTNKFIVDNKLNDFNLNLSVNYKDSMLEITAKKTTSNNTTGGTTKEIKNNYSYQLTYIDKTTKKFNTLNSLLFEIYNINETKLKELSAVYGIDSKDKDVNYKTIVKYLNSLTDVKITHSNIFINLTNENCIKVIAASQNTNIAYITLFNNDKKSNDFIIDLQIYNEIELTPESVNNNTLDTETTMDDTENLDA
jgi:hypothetical protein